MAIYECLIFKESQLKIRRDHCHKQDVFVKHHAPLKGAIFGLTGKCQVFTLSFGTTDRRTQLKRYALNLLMLGV